MTLEELEKRRKEIDNNIETAITNMDTIIAETNRVADVAHNSQKILDDLDREFEQQTGLNEKDMAFLFVAVGLQCVRILFLNHITRIQKAGSGNTLEEALHEHQKTILGKLDNGLVDTARPYYAPLNQIITIKGVPYDATAYLDEKHALFKGANHRFSTLGHEPIAGLVFGTANILTNTITCYNKPMLTTNHVVYTPQFKSPKIATFCPTTQMVLTACNRIKDDKESVVAAVIKQIIHVGTDMFTPCGIQLPLVNLTLSKPEIEELTKQFGTGDLVKAGIGYSLAAFIDLIIATVHGLLYDEKYCDNKDIYIVKTKKIIKYSNIIASTSNVIWVGVNMHIGNETAIRDLDIGGLLNTIRRLYSDKAFVRQVKEEFVFGGFNRLIQGEELDIVDIEKLSF